MCTVIISCVPVRRWFDHPDEEEQWGYDYREDMITQFEQDLYNENFTIQDQGKDDPIDTLENRSELWPNVFDIDDGPIPDKFYDYDYNNEGLDHSVRGADIGFKKLLDILRSK